MKLAVPWLAAQAIDALQTGGGGAGAAARRCRGSARSSASLGAELGAARAGARARAQRWRCGCAAALADALYERLAAAPLAWHDAPPSRASCSTAWRRASGALFDFTQNQFIYLQSAVNLVGPLVALTLLSALAGGAGAAPASSLIAVVDRRASTAR